MATLQRTAPPPALRVDAEVPPMQSAIFGIGIDSAVNLLEAREYEGLDRTQRLRKALDEQRSFVGQLLGSSTGLVDLRTRVDPDATVPLSVCLLGRTWGPDAGECEARAVERREQLLASIPRHLRASAIEDADTLASWLAPDLAATGEPTIESAIITRQEITGVPRRPDAKVAYYFSVVPFNWTEPDWTGLYATISACAVPLTLSVALLPIPLTPGYSGLLAHYATFYARLAKEDRLDGGLYHGERLLPPDDFAVAAQPVFEDYSRRYVERVFAIRIQVSAAGRLPAGIPEAIGSAISPGDVSPTHLSGHRAASSYEVRRARTSYELDLSRWNLATLDVGMFDGAPDIWRRPDPPPEPLAALCMLGDARDATCAFRFPIALDGTVPGFRVGRGAFGHEQLSPPDSQAALRLGHLPGRRAAVALPLRDLTKHALVVGATGSGKTTTILELLRQLWTEHGVPFMVIEPVNADADDYRRFLAEPGVGDDIEVYTVGDEGLCPLRFNPFEVPQRVLVGEHVANLLACFTAAFGLWEPLPSIYRDALNSMYLEAGVLLAERASEERRQQWPTVVEFLRAMRKVTADMGYAGEVKHNIEAASIRRAEQMTSGVAASAFFTDRPNDITRLLDRPVVLELKSLGSGDEQALMIALLLNAVTEHYQAVRGASPRLEHVTVIEEAHRLLARPQGAGGQEQAQAKEKAAEAFANTLSENRKYGEGVVIAEQIPTKLVVDAVKNTNLKVLHRLTAEEDREYVGETMGLDERQKRFATRLATGEALLYADVLPEAVEVAISPELASSSPVAPSPRAAPPFEGCSACRARCRYRGAALAMARDGRLVTEVARSVHALEESGVSPADREAAWGALLTALRSQVTAFASLPAEDPGLSDASYCVFLHALASMRMHFAPAWHVGVAERLGIEPVKRSAS